MLGLLSTANWLTTIDPSLSDCISVGKIDGNAEKWIGVYNSKHASQTTPICIGGMGTTLTAEKQITLLIHWTRLSTKAEEKALELYNRLLGLSHFLIGDVSVNFIDPGNGPIPIGVDDNGICEYVIELKIVYERND